jgi:hypothetical protein
MSTVILGFSVVYLIESMFLVAGDSCIALIRVKICESFLGETEKN